MIANLIAAAVLPLAFVSSAPPSPSPAPPPVEQQSEGKTSTSVTVTIGDTKIQITVPGSGKPTITTNGEPAEVTATPAESTPAATPTPSPKPDTQDDEIADQEAAQGAPGDAASVADEVFRLTNEYREANGLPALERNTCLDKTAQAHAEKMIGQLEAIAANDGKGDIHHANLDEVAKECPDVASENIAALQPDAAEAVDDWKNSPGHDKNMRGDHKSIGVGVTVEDGKTTFVQQFA